mmetsp:Transcript_14962/g.25386  ORF Transcript_14962/g.25386 Transcript_14962/m.25386 type:complete len:171 (+) Transcript_14962:277-789(+)
MAISWAVTFPPPPATWALSMAAWAAASKVTPMGVTETAPPPLSLEALTISSDVLGAETKPTSVFQDGAIAGHMNQTKKVPKGTVIGANATNVRDECLLHCRNVATDPNNGRANRFAVFTIADMILSKHYISPYVTILAAVCVTTCIPAACCLPQKNNGDNDGDDRGAFRR